MQWCMQGVYKIYPTPIDKRTPVLVQVETSHCGVNAKYSSRLLSHPLGLIVPCVGTTSPNAWDVSSSVFLYMIICILPYVTIRIFGYIHHLHHLHRYLHHFSPSLSDCYTLVYVVYVVSKIKIFKNRMRSDISRPCSTTSSIPRMNKSLTCL